MKGVKSHYCLRLTLFPSPLSPLALSSPLPLSSFPSLPSLLLTGDPDLLQRPVVIVRVDFFDRRQDLEAPDQAAEHGVLVVEVRAGLVRDEELGAVGGGACLKERRGRNVRKQEREYVYVRERKRYCASAPISSPPLLRVQ